MQSDCCWPQASTVRSPWFPDEFAAFAHLLCCTSHERTTALCWLLNAELPSTWNLPSPVAVTVGAVTPPSAPVKVWRLPAVLAAALDVESDALAVELAAALLELEAEELSAEQELLSLLLLPVACEDRSVRCIYIQQ